MNVVLSLMQRDQ